MISVVYRGCGIPVAWKIVSATAKGSWQPHWLELLKRLEGIVPSDWLVIVSADRGLYAKWLYQRIQDNGWHPFLRINQQGQFQPVAQREFLPLDSLITQEGQSWSGRVTCFKTNQLDCTLVARWDAGYREPWLIVTDLEPNRADVCWYSMRSWIECLFQDAKRGGWQWHQTKMIQPERAERHWLAIALATLWMISIGGEAEAQMSESAPVNSSSASTVTPIANSSVSPTRLLSCFRRGMILLLAHVLNRLPLPMGSLIPQFSGQSFFLSSA